MLDPNVNYAGRLIAYAPFMETMGDRIKMLREAKRLTQAELGKLVGGLSKSAVSQWELGQTSDIRLKTFLRLLEVLGTKYEYLVFGPDRGPGSRGGGVGRGRLNDET